MHINLKRFKYNLPLIFASLTLLFASLAVAQQAESPRVDSFTLVEADTGQVLRVYPNTADVNRVYLPLEQARAISFSFDTSNASSVRISGVSPEPRLENQQPFSLLGDDGTTYEPWSPAVGVYTIVVEPFSQANASGEQGQSATLSLTVTDDVQTPDEPEPTPPVSTTPRPTVPFSAGNIAPITALLLLSDDGGSAYTLSQAMATSAGVFDVDGKLIRTLWSNRQQAAGNHPTPEWDGLDDQGVDASTRGDSILIVANDIQVEWEGTIGNTSDTFATEDVHRQFQYYHDMIITDNDAYFSMDYTENWGSSVRVDLENPQKRVSVMPRLLVQQATDRIATDGQRLYMAGRQVRNAEGGLELKVTYVQAAEFSNLNNFANYLPFQNETLQIHGGVFRAGDIVIDDRSGIPHEEGRARVTGLAVQTTGNWLFVARKKLDSLRVVHKISGELAQEYTFIEPKLNKIDAQGNLWMVHNETVEKFTVREDGSIISTGFVIGGFIDIQGMDISPDGRTVAIADAATRSHQVFGYSTSTGARQWTLGRNESYEASSTVYNDKFLFRSKHEELYAAAADNGVINVPSGDRLSFIAYESNGSFWIGDRGNYRSLKFSANRDYLDQIMWLPATYNTHVDPNDPTRVFGDYLEFKVDYSLPLEPGNDNQSWELVNNWSEGVVLGRDFPAGDRLKNVTTLSNQRTYFLAPNTSVEVVSAEREIFELIAPNLQSTQGIMRATGVTVNDIAGSIELKGDDRITWAVVDFVDGVAQSTLYEQRIIGFSNGNPILGQAEVFATFETDNELFSNGAQVLTGDITESGNWVVFNGSTYNATANRNDFVRVDGFDDLQPPLYVGAHLAGIKRGTNTLSFRTAEAVDLDTGNPFPLNGEFDVRRFSENYGGSVALAQGEFIVWGYYGEGWEQTQTNIWNMVSEEGLFLRQFGVADANIFGLSTQGMAGNAFSPALVKVGDDMYLWHNDESYHAGLSRWKISNLSSVQRITLPLNN